MIAGSIHHGVIERAYKYLYILDWLWAWWLLLWLLLLLLLIVRSNDSCGEVNMWVPYWTLVHTPIEGKLSTLIFYYIPVWKGEVSNSQKSNGSNESNGKSEQKLCDMRIVSLLAQRELQTADVTTFWIPILAKILQAVLSVSTVPRWLCLRKRYGHFRTMHRRDAWSDPPKQRQTWHHQSPISTITYTNSSWVIISTVAQ